MLQTVRRRSDTPMMAECMIDLIDNDPHHPSFQERKSPAEKLDSPKFGKTCKVWPRGLPQFRFGRDAPMSWYSDIHVHTCVHIRIRTMMHVCFCMMHKLSMPCVHVWWYRLHQPTSWATKDVVGKVATFTYHLFWNYVAGRDDGWSEMMFHRLHWVSLHYKCMEGIQVNTLGYKMCYASSVRPSHSRVART